MESILKSVKKTLGIEESYEHFDQDIILSINTVLMSLTQIGLGPIEGFVVDDVTQTWSDLLADRQDIEGVKTYVYLKVRMVFDPPATSFLIDAMERQVSELEWRIRHQIES